MTQLLELEMWSKRYLGNIPHLISSFQSLQFLPQVMIFHSKASFLFLLRYATYNELSTLHGSYQRPEISEVTWVCILWILFWTKYKGQIIVFTITWLFASTNSFGVVFFEPWELNFGSRISKFRFSVRASYKLKNGAIKWMIVPLINQILSHLNNTLSSTSFSLHNVLNLSQS